MFIHGSVNASFLAHDWISLYVALELMAISAFLLLAEPGRPKSSWVALRYLLVGNSGMLFYLLGAALIYQNQHSFSFDGLGNAPPEALSLLLLGLTVKGGVFASGLWLPLTHASAPAPISALLSGVVVKASVLPLLRMAEGLPSLDLPLRILGTGAALLGWRMRF